MTTEERIEELEEMKSEYILNESVLPDPCTWGELAEAQAKAEEQWNQTDAGKELKALLENQEIELIASGYEWECPCGELNRQSGVTEKVTCPSCHRTYTVSDYHHAFGE